MDQSTLDYYATPGRFTTLANGVTLRDVREIVEAVQQLLIYDVVSKPFYGVELSPAQADTIHERDTERLLAVARSIDPAPIGADRPAAHRVGARCHVYSRVAVALLRCAGVPARARCGFATFFRPGWYEDHWVAEYYDIAGERWRMVDAQLDPVWRTMIGFTSDPLDVTPEQFVTAGHAWQAWRSGRVDANRCGLGSIDEHGSYWIAGNLRLDLASLNKVEMLPWDVWGAGWQPGEEPSDAVLRLYDEVAELTTSVDERFDELRNRYDTDAQLHMDGTVFNGLRQRMEIVT